MRRTPQQSRFLGLWTAAWLFVLLLGLLLWLGDPALQWPVLLVPVVWALVAWRRGRGARPAVRGPYDDPEPWPPDDDAEPWLPDDEHWPPHDPPPRERRPPPTRELPWLPEVPRDRREE
jgi:hypothetical protein